MIWTGVAQSVDVISHVAACPSGSEISSSVSVTRNLLLTIRAIPPLPCECPTLSGAGRAYKVIFLFVSR